MGDSEKICRRRLRLTSTHRDPVAPSTTSLFRQGVLEQEALRHPPLDPFTPGPGSGRQRPVALPPCRRTNCCRFAKTGKGELWHRTSRLQLAAAPAA